MARDKDKQIFNYCWEVAFHNLVLLCAIFKIVTRQSYVVLN